MIDCNAFADMSSVSGFADILLPLKIYLSAFKNLYLHLWMSKSIFAVEISISAFEDVYICISRYFYIPIGKYLYANMYLHCVSISVLANN